MGFIKGPYTSDQTQQYMRSIIILAFVLFVTTVADPASDQTKTRLDRSVPTIDYLGRHAGNITLPRSRGLRMFYFFFQSKRSRNDPVVVWLTGGPGVGSEFAMLYENGPVTFSENNQSLSWNKFGWNHVANMLFVDNPVGTGFSQVPNKKDLCHSETCVANDLYHFIQAFFKKNRGLAKNPFYITGESYAGHYIPAFASRIHQANKQKKGIHVNLKGFAMGNGLTNPRIQYAAYPDYVLKTGLVNLADYHRIAKDILPPCIRSIELCGSHGGHHCGISKDICDYVVMKIKKIALKDRSVYDVRKTCNPNPCPNDYPIMVKFLNSGRHALGVGNKTFEFSNNNVYGALSRDWMKNLDVGIPDLLNDGIKVLVYAGEFDFICNWLGNWRWARALKWNGDAGFASSRTKPFMVDGAAAGELNRYGSLSFLKVHEAGHMVPGDQPRAALHMLQKWMNGSLV